MTPLPPKVDASLRALQATFAGESEAAVKRLRSAAADVLTRYLTGGEPAAEPDGEPAPEPPPPPPPAAPAPPPPEGVEAPAEPTATKGDPLTDAAALDRLAASKGRDWGGIVKNLNKRFGTKYGFRTLWLSVPAEQRAAVVDGLNKMADVATAPPAEVTADTAFAAVEDAGKAAKMSANGMLAHILAELQIETGYLGDMNPAELAAVAKLAREKAAACRGQKGA